VKALFVASRHACQVIPGTMLYRMLKPCASPDRKFARAFVKPVFKGLARPEVRLFASAHQALR